MDLNALNSVRKQPSQRGATENIAVQVTGYDTTDADPAKHLVLGTRLDTGEDIKVFLRPDTDASGRKKPRPEVADFASDRAKVATEIGGVIRFDRAYEVKDQSGTFNAYWGQSLSHFPGEANVLIGLTRVLPPKDFGDGMKRQATEIVFADHATIAHDVKSLKATVESALGAEVPGAQGAYLRVEAQGEKGPEVLSFRVGSSAAKDAAGKVIGKASPVESYTAWSQGDTGKVVIDQIERTVAAGKSVEIEVIPMTRLNVGADTLTTTIDKNATLDEAFKYKDGTGHGFAPASIAIRTRENGSSYVTDVKPLSNNRVFFTVENIPTATRGGEPAPVENADLSSSEEMEFDAADVPAAPAAPARAPLASLDNVSRRSAGRGR